MTTEDDTPVAPTSGGATRPVPGRDLLGRHAELAFLRGALAEVRAGSARLVALSGDPGIGKTRLARELLQDAAADGFAVRIARCFEGDSTPFGPLAPSLLPLVGLSIGDLVDSALDPAAAVVQALGATDRQPPIAFLVDDVQWADDASLGVLAAIADAIAAGAIASSMVVLTVRTGTEPTPPAVAALRRRPSCVTVVPEPLDTYDTRELLLRRGLDLTPAQAEEVRRATRGNPLLIDMAAGLLDDGSTITAADLDALGDVTGSTRARLADLPAETAAVLEAIASTGIAHRSSLGAVCGLADDELEERLSPAVARGVAEVVGDEVTIAHPLYLDAILGGASSDRRRRLDAAWFEHLRRGDDPTTLTRRADHALGAEAIVDAAAAADTLIPAGRQAYAAHAMNAAVRYLGAGLRLARGGRTLAPAEEALIRQELGVAQIRTHHTREGIANLERAAAAFAGLGDRAAQARTIVDLLSARITSQPVGTRLDLGEVETLAEQLEAVDPVAAAWLWAELSGASLATVRFGQAERHARRALAFARRGVNPRAALRAHATIGVVRWNELRMNDAAEEFHAGSELVGPGDVKWYLEPRLRELLTRAWSGRWDEVRSLLATTHQLSAASGYWKENSFAQLGQAVLDHGSGDLASAEATLARARRDVELSEYRQTALLLLPFHTGVLTEMDRLAEARGAIDHWRASEPDGSPVRIAADLAAVWIDVASATIADLDEASERAVRAAAQLGAFTFLGAEALAACVVDIAFVTRRPDLVDGVTATLDVALAGGMRYSSGLPFDLERARALARWLAGDEDAARFELIELVASGDRDGRRLHAAQALAALVEVTAGRARDEHREALATRAEQLGAWRLARVARPSVVRVPPCADRYVVCARMSGDEPAPDDIEARLRAEIAGHGGSASGRSHPDGGVIGWFDQPIAAVAAAAACARLSAAHGGRVGVAAGELVERADNAFGNAVNLAARLCGLADAGALRACARTVDGAREARFSDTGLHQLKGFDRPVRVYSLSFADA